MLAVLPGNKISLFDNFDKLDFEKIKKDKMFTFEMKTIEKPIMDAEDLELILEK